MDEAELAFEAYDFENDAAWKLIEQHLEVAGGVDKQAALLKRKRKYFMKNVDQRLVVDRVQKEKEDKPTGSDTTSTSSSAAAGAAGFVGKVLDKFNLSRDSIIKINYARLYAHIVLVLASVFAFVLLNSSFGVWMYYKLFQLSGFVSIVHLFVTYGKPSTDEAYLRRVLFDDSVHNILFCLALNFTSPSSTYLFPLLLRSLLFCAESLPRVPMHPMLNSVKVKITPLLSKVESRKSEILQWIAQIEVFMAIGMLIALLTPSRQILSTFVFGQYIRVRYSLSGYTKQAFSGIRRFLDSWLLSPRSPAILQSIYLKICNFLSRLGDPAPRNAGQPQSSCNIQ